MKLILLFLFVWGVCAEEPENGYGGYKVYRMKPVTRDHNELLMNLVKSKDLDFWSDPNDAGLPVDIMVKPNDQNIFERVMLKNEITFEIFVEDVQE